MLASGAAAHGHMSAPGSMCCHALGCGANRLTLDRASIPAPSIRGRAAALGRPAQGGRVAHALALYRRLAAVPLWRAAVLFRHCGPFGPLGGRLPGPGAFRSARGPSSGPLGRPPASARRVRLLAFGLAFPCRGPLRLPVPRPSSALVSVARARGFGLLGGRGCAPSVPLWAVWPPCVSWLLSPAPLSPGFAWRRLRRRCFSNRGDVAFAASQGSAVRPGRAGSLPLNGCFPCPSSFAIDAVALAGYNVPGR